MSEEIDSPEQPEIVKCIICNITITTDVNNHKCSFRNNCDKIVKITRY